MKLQHLFEDVPAPNQVAWFNATTKKYISLGEVPHSLYALENGKQMGLENDRQFKRFIKLHNEEVEKGDDTLLDGDEEFLDFMFKKEWVRIIHRHDDWGGSNKNPAPPAPRGWSGRDLGVASAAPIMGNDTNIQSNNLRNVVKAARFINKSSPIEKLFIQKDPWDHATMLSGKRLALFLKHGRIPSSRISESKDEIDAGWIDPNNVIHPVGMPGAHLDWLVNEFNLPEPNVRENSNIFGMAFDQGYVRFRITWDDHLDIEGRKEDLKRSFKVWRQYANRKINLTITDEGYEILELDSLKDIKKILESTLVEERQKGKSLPETGYQYRNATIYRAVLDIVNNFAPMDYVTMSRKFAVEHAEHLAVTEEETAHVLRARVKASDVYEAYNPGEYFYDGPPVENVRVIHIAKGWGDES